MPVILFSPNSPGYLRWISQFPVVCITISMETVGSKPYFCVSCLTNMVGNSDQRLLMTAKTKYRN